MKNLDTFVNVYAEELAAVVAKTPEDYPWFRGETTVETVVERMRVAFQNMTFNKGGNAIRATCRRLGIKHTYTAIGAYLRG